ncbi:hypothetical protein Tco_0973669 [Tanacetum coccineum]
MLRKDEDEHEFLAEEQPLTGRVTESDPEEDPEEYEDDERRMSSVLNIPTGRWSDGDVDDGDSSRDDADDEDGEEEEEKEDRGGEHLVRLTLLPFIPVD